MQILEKLEEEIKRKKDLFINGLYGVIWIWVDINGVIFEIDMG